VDPHGCESGGESGIQISTGTWGLNGRAYGSEGWGFESLRAHSLTASNNDSRGTVEYTARASLVVMLAIGNEVAECAFPAASFDEVTRFIVATDADETTG